MIEHDTLIGREQAREMNMRAERDLTRIAALDISSPVHYQGLGKTAVMEWKKIEVDELQRIRNNVEARLAKTYVDTGGKWSEAKNIVSTGREIRLYAGKAVNLTVRV